MVAGSLSDCTLLHLTHLGVGLDGFLQTLQVRHVQEGGLDAVVDHDLLEEAVSSCREHGTDKVAVSHSAGYSDSSYPHRRLSHEWEQLKRKNRGVSREIIVSGRHSGP